MKELIASICKALVDCPEKVNIKEIQTGTTIIFEIRVDPQDIGKVIGKSGKTAHALRQILNSIASKENKRIVLEIIE